MNGRAAGDASRLNDVGEIARLLFAVTDQVRQNFAAVAADLGLTPMQARALLTLRDAAPMRSLADDLHCDASNVTGIADRLEARGLVSREADSNDRRVKLLAITPEGARLRERLTRSVTESSPISTAFTTEERAALRQLLVKLVLAGGTVRGRDPKDVWA